MPGVPWDHLGPLAPLFKEILFLAVPRARAHRGRGHSDTHVSRSFNPLSKARLPISGLKLSSQSLGEDTLSKAESSPKRQDGQEPGALWAHEGPRRDGTRGAPPLAELAARRGFRAPVGFL